MKIDELQQEAKSLAAWDRHRFLWLVGGVIIVAIFMVGVALSLYHSSGAAQLDLSRPGYRTVRKEAGQKQARTVTYPSSGQFDEKALAEFRSLYQDRVNRITATRSFEASAISDDALQLYETATPSP